MAKKKSTAFFLLILIFMNFYVFGVAASAASSQMKLDTLWTTETIALSDSVLSNALDLQFEQTEGYFSIQLTVTGDGTLKVEYLCSNDNSQFDIPENASAILSGITKTSGPDSDGQLIESFNVEICRYLKIKITETGGANSVTVTAKLLYK